MPTHDPRKIVEDLRDHLSQHDTSIAFLFGAGTSCSVLRKTAAGTPIPLIPSVEELTNTCKERVRSLDTKNGGHGTKFASAWEGLAGEAKPSTRNVNIEDILSCVRRKRDAVGLGEKLAGLSKEELETLEEKIKAGIAEEVCPAEDIFPDKLPHDKLAQWIARIPRKRPVEVFTTNYDIVLERALETERVPFFDGFVGAYRPFFCHDSLNRPEAAPGAGWTRLWKVHGSVNWSRVEMRGRQQIVRTQVTKTGELILPSHYKYDESRKQPYVALVERLDEILSREDTILLVVGFSFSDEHLNAIIFDSLEKKNRPHIYALQFSDPPDTHELVKVAKRRLNLLVMGPRRAVIRGELGDWRLTEPVDDRTAPFMDVSFDSDAGQPDKPDEPQLTGKFRLGDFCQFCDFLESMVGEG